MKSVGVFKKRLDKSCRRNIILAKGQLGLTRLFAKNYRYDIIDAKLA